MAPRNAVSKTRDDRKREREVPSDRSPRRIRIGGEGTYEEVVDRVDCPVCGRPCED
jgi:hypothetical protein